MDYKLLGIAQAYTEEKIKEAGGMTSEGVAEIVKGTVGPEVNAYLAEIQVTPQMFGAKGDGVTDDTEAFKKALEYHNVIIPRGSYIISETLTVQQTKKVTGCNWRGTNIIFKGTGYCFELVNGAILQDITIDCTAMEYTNDIDVLGDLEETNPLTQTILRENVSGVYLGSSHSKTSRVCVRNASQYGFNSYAYSEVADCIVGNCDIGFYVHHDSQIYDCAGQNFRIGIYIDSSTNRIENIRLDSCSEAFLYLSLSGSNNYVSFLGGQCYKNGIINAGGGLNEIHAIISRSNIISKGKEYSNYNDDDYAILETEYNIGNNYDISIRIGDSYDYNGETHCYFPRRFFKNTNSNSNVRIKSKIPTSNDTCIETVMPYNTDVTSLFSINSSSSYVNIDINNIQYKVMNKKWVNSDGYELGIMGSELITIAKVNEIPTVPTQYIGHNYFTSDNLQELGLDAGRYIIELTGSDTFGKQIWTFCSETECKQYVRTYYNNAWSELKETTLS